MEEKTKFKMSIRKVVPMSADGFQRLKLIHRLNFKREVYKPVGKVLIDINRVFNEKTLAVFLYSQFGAGTYTGHFWSAETHKLQKQAFKVVISGNFESSWSYEFLDTRGLARRWWWQGEY